jgi:hypothetical protein
MVSHLNYSWSLGTDGIDIEEIWDCDMRTLQVLQHLRMVSGDVAPPFYPVYSRPEATSRAATPQKTRPERAGHGERDGAYRDGGQPERVQETRRRAADDDRGNGRGDGRSNGADRRADNSADMDESERRRAAIRERPYRLTGSTILK